MMKRTKSVQSHHPTHKTLNTPYRSHQSIMRAIEEHIARKLDIDIIIHYQQYFNQFMTKCKNLQNYLYHAPSDTQSKYINNNDTHFYYALQYLMLDLFRRGVIPPGSYDNLRMEAIEEMQMWVLGWIQRRLERQFQDKQEIEQIATVVSVLEEIDSYVLEIDREQLRWEAKPNK